MALIAFLLPDWRIFAVEVAQDYVVVFNSNAAKLGMLGMQAVSVVRLYVLAKALVEDFTTNVRVQEHAMDRGLSINREVTLRIAESMRDLIERIRPEAVLAINALDAYSKKRWLRILP